MQKFTNPLSSEIMPDPFVVYDDITGYYYALCSRYDKVEIYRSKKVFNLLSDGDNKVVYRANDKDGNSRNIWAPEMHKAPDGKWYIYTSGMVAGEEWCPRLFVLQSQSNDPFGDWVYKGHILPNANALDPTVYTAKDGKQYACYSRAYPKINQALEIRELINPYTFGEKHAVIAHAEYDWELVPPYDISWAMVEGPFFVENDGRLFIIYSANGCYSDDYCLGVLEYLGGEMCDASSWKKHQAPVFVKGNGLYGPGHASFFKSPDKTETWIAYHTLQTSDPKASIRERLMNVQRFYFDESGFPKKSCPVGSGVEQASPSGEK